MNAPVRQSQADILSKLYDMKRKQIEQALRQGHSFRCQVLEAEAEAISNALKAVR
ncbi:MAG: Carlavirus endopeptidase [Marinobacter excellens HL-55]|uniref:Carlavirus endopeptidase n=1 Tax=Marinobacter excellens HL-55 TaxID=1305731 RepID=A0A0P7ZBC6_9GAMM|nr:MAG: Carlavirus endopeptidase [Marinobacter excellens HL-55]